MVYVDLRERRDDERRRGAGRSPRGIIENPYALLVAGTVLATLAAASYALAWGPNPLPELVLSCLPAAVLLFWAGRGLRWPRGRHAGNGFGAEKLVLLAIRDAGGAITPVGAALETPLTVDEAEGVLLRLAHDGHLGVESHDGTLYYVLPRKLPPAGPLGRG